MALQFNDIFDFDGYKKAIKELDSENKTFGKNVIEINKQISSSYEMIKSDLKEYAAILRDFSVGGKGASTRLAEIGAESDRLTSRLKNQKDAISVLNQVQDINTLSTNELKAAATALKNEYDSLRGDTTDLTKKKAALGGQLSQVTAAIKLQTAATKEVSKEVKYAAGTYKAWEAEMKDIRNALVNMTNAFDPLTGKINEQNKEAVALQQRYVQLNDTLKNIDSGLGNFQRNVGNYKSGFAGINNAIGQITREGPSAAVGLQTFFLAISNNIGPLQDAISQLNALRASGEKVPSTFQAIKSAIFSWNTAISLGITLLVLYGKEVADFASKLFEAKKVFDSAAESARIFDEAFKESSVVNAVEQVSELRSLVGLAKEGFVEKDKVLKIYNDTIGKTAGAAKNLADIEKFLADQAEAYIQFTLLKAAANLALEDAAKKALEIEKKRQNQITGTEIVSGAGGVLLSSKEVDRQKQLQKKANEERLKEDEDAKNKLIKISDDLFRQAAELAKKNKLKFLPDEKENESDANKALNEYEKLLRERQRIIKEDFETSNKLAEDARENNLISDIELAKEKVRIANIFAEKSINEETAINKVGYKAKESLIRDFNNVVVQANKNLSAAQRKLTEEEIRLEQKRIDERANQLIQDVKNSRDFILSNQRISNAEREQLELDFQKRLDDISINALEQRAEIELDLVKKAELKKQANILRSRSARTQDFGTSILLPRAQGADDIRALENSLERRRILGTLTIESEIQTAKEIIAIKTKLNEDTSELEIRLFELQQNLQQQIVDELKQSSQIVGGIIGEEFGSLFDTVIDKFQMLANGGKLAYQDFADFASQTANAITENYKMNLDQQLTNLEKQKEAELKAVGNNQAAQDAINKKYAKEEAILKRKQAKADRDNAVFQVLINTSQAVQKAVAASPLTFGLPWSAAAAAIGALQVAAILSRPLPQFEKGTENAPEGLALVGEKGKEMVIDPSGKLRIVGEDGPEITYLKGGSKVKTAQKTKEILERAESENILREILMNGRLSADLRTGKEEQAAYTMSKALQQSGMNANVLGGLFSDAVGKIPVHMNIFDEKGYRQAIKQGNRTTTYLNNFKMSR